jgi:hypothetical protein
MELITYIHKAVPSVDLIRHSAALDVGFYLNKPLLKEQGFLNYSFSRWGLGNFRPEFSRSAMEFAYSIPNVVS